MKNNIVFKANLTKLSHRERGKPCQDAFEFYQGDSFNVLAVADGLGSEMYSDIGAQVAASTAVGYCRDNISADLDVENVKAVMRDAYYAAYQAVLARASDDDNDPEEYDTTLCLTIIYPDGCVYYAQSGDSGMVVLLENGLYKKVTSQQRDDEGRVFPLCFPDKWVFGCVEEKVSSVMLMTDGVLDLVCPRLLKGREVDINIPFARRFLDKFDCSSEDIPALEEAMKGYLENVPQSLLDDDVTVIVNVATDRKPAAREASYYEAPDWESFRIDFSELTDENPDVNLDSVTESCDSSNGNSDEASGDGETLEVPSPGESAGTKKKKCILKTKRQGARRILRAVIRKKTVILCILIIVFYVMIRKILIS